VFLLVSAVTAAAVVRAGLRVYFGLGVPPSDEDADTSSGRDEEPETSSRLHRLPRTMMLAVVLLLGSSLAVGTVPWIRALAADAGTQDADRPGHLHDVLPVLPAPTSTPPVAVEWTASGLVPSAGGGVLALLFCAAALWPRRLPSWPPLLRRGLRARHRGHSGHIGDYVAWLLAGVTVLAGLVWLCAGSAAGGGSCPPLWPAEPTDAASCGTASSNSWPGTPAKLAVSVLGRQGTVGTRHASPQSGGSGAVPRRRARRSAR
jgi:multicomponent Na+:H+ antiporter subunit D